MGYPFLRQFISRGYIQIAYGFAIKYGKGEGEKRRNEEVMEIIDNNEFENKGRNGDWENRRNGDLENYSFLLQFTDSPFHRFIEL